MCPLRARRFLSNNVPSARALLKYVTAVLYLFPVATFFTDFLVSCCVAEAFICLYRQVVRTALHSYIFLPMLCILRFLICGVHNTNRVFRSKHADREITCSSFSVVRTDGCLDLYLAMPTRSLLSTKAKVACLPLHALEGDEDDTRSGAFANCWSISRTVPTTWTATIFPDYDPYGECPGTVAPLMSVAMQLAAVCFVMKSCVDHRS